MSSSQQYAKVIFPNTRRVFGFVLQPVTIGHALLLTRLKNAFILGTPEQPGDIVEALYVLSRDWRQAERGLRRSWLIWARFTLWGLQIRFQSRTTKLIAAAQIDEHINEHWEGPCTWDGVDEDGKSGKILRSPRLAIMKTRLMSCFRLNRDEALDYRLAEAEWDIACWGEERNAVDLVPEDVADFIAGDKK